MFRSPKYCDCYEYIPIQLDTPITTPGAGVAQQKNGYQFTINDRSSYFDWFSAYFEVDFKVVQESNANYLATVRIAMINDAASLIADMQVKQNGKTVYDSNNLYKVTNIKNLLTMSQDYTNSSATSEYFYLDTGDTTVKDVSDVNYNKGFAIRSALFLTGKIQNSIIPLNKFSFFEGSERNLLPPSQIQISPKLTDDATLIYRNNGVDAGKVVISKLVLWIPRMFFNSDGLNFVQNNHTKTEWVSLRKMVQVSQDSEQREATFNITSGVKQPKHIFVYLQRTVRSSNQEHNPYILDTFKVNADNNEYYLSAARLEVGNGVYNPELEYSENDKVRIYRDVINYVHKQNDKNTGSLLTRDNFDKLFGFLYFNLTYKSDSITADPTQIVLRYKLSSAPAAGSDYTVYAIILYEEEVRIDPIGNEILII